MYDKAQQQNFYKLSKHFLEKGAQETDINDLKDILRFHEWKYYVKNDPVLSDYEYDILFKQLQDIEAKHPNLLTSDSPTQRVSSDLTTEFPSVPHMLPMLSLNNSYNESDLRKFDEQVKKLVKLESSTTIDYSVEPKFDGGSIAILYEGDIMVRAATRGNGVLGEEITPNARVLPSIPLRTSFSDKGIHLAEVRGEAVIHKEKFRQLNLEREENGLTPFANPRNSAAGGLRTKNPQETRNREIEVFAFHLSYAAGSDGKDVLNKFDNHVDQIRLLEKLGFKTANPEKMLCHGIDEVLAKIRGWEERRENFNYEIDGAVIKVNNLEWQQKCGSTLHHPRWAIAFKFKAKQATTQLLGVEYQVGKVGSITPVAKVKPVHLAGVTVSSISLHNEEFISSKDLRIGDQVVVERAGDVIPYIVKSLPELRDGNEKEISFPAECPVNTTDETVLLVREKGEAAWRCPNCICGAQDLQRIVFHVSKDAMDIDGFGKSYIERFHSLGWIRDISDVYNLDYSQIEKLEGFGKRSSENLKKSVDKAKKNSLAKLLHSLSIHHLGRKASKIIAQEIESVYELAAWKASDFTKLRDIGPVVAKNVMAYFSVSSNLEMLKRMEEHGVNVYRTIEDRPLKVAADAPLVGKTILFTGTLQQMTRDKAKEVAEKAGAKNLSAVSSNLNILVVGEKAGSKLKKAESLGTVQIMTEEEFLKIVS